MYDDAGSRSEVGAVNQQDDEVPLVEQLAVAILRQSSVDPRVLAAQYRKPGAMCDREWRLTLHAARERLNEVGITTAVDNCGLIYQTNAKQTEARAKTFAQTVYRKMQRIVVITRNAAAMTEDPQARERLELAAQKREASLLAAKREARRAARPRPPGL